MSKRLLYPKISIFMRLFYHKIPILTEFCQSEISILIRFFLIINCLNAEIFQYKSK